MYSWSLKKLVTISTHKGLYQCNHLQFGVSSASSVFQRTMGGNVSNLPNVVIYSWQDHRRRIISGHWIRSSPGWKKHGWNKESKCSFMMPSIEYLGHRISEGGIHPNEKKKRAILQVPAPRNLQQLRSFLGMVNYYGKFLPHLASTLTRLYSLLKKCTLWHWDRNEDEAFKIKNLY